MNLTKRLQRLETIQPNNPAQNNSIVADWLKTLSVTDLIFLRDCKHSVSFRVENPDRYNKLKTDFNEYQRSKSNEHRKQT